MNYNNISQCKTVGERIKFIREKNKKNQKEFGESLNKGQHAISRLENSGDDISIKDIKAIAKKYNVSHELLISGIDSDTLLSTLCNYISFTYKSLQIGEETYEFPCIYIKENFFQYLLQYNNCNSNQSIPSDIKNLWLKSIIDTFNNNQSSDDFFKLTIFPYNLILPSNERSTWNLNQLLSNTKIEFENYANGKKM